MIAVNIEPSWKIALQHEFEQPYFEHIVHYIKQQKQQGKVIYPAGAHIFEAFAHTPLHAVKCVLLGQDPYHGAGQAHGLSFSVLPPTPPPPSLQNIYKELCTDVGCTMPTHGNLTSWATQGVLLLNSCLTVEANKPMSHSKIGWQQLTNAVLSILSTQKHNLVFMLWGKQAQEKKGLIHANKHLILESPHPSPLSAYTGYWGSAHFSKANTYLEAHGIQPIHWALD